MIRITKLQLRSYRGIKALEADVPSAGLIAKGRNGSGKTTVLRSIGAALASADIGPDAVKIGDDEGEILIDLDVAGRALQVRRRFGASGSTLTVRNDEGDKKAKPTEVLAKLLGAAPLDVISVVLEKDKKKRRELIMKALPVKVTREQMLRWVPTLKEDADLSGHGLEVIERIRKQAYDRRTEANRVAKEAAANAARLREGATAARAAVPADAPSMLDARLAWDAAEEARREILGRKRAAELATERTTKLRGEAARLREEASALTSTAADCPSTEELTAAEKELNGRDETVIRLQDELDRAMAAAEAAGENLGRLRAKSDRAVQASARIEELTSQANAIETGIADAVAPVPADEIAAVDAKTAKAQADHDAAFLRTDAEVKEKGAADAHDAASTAQAEADRLDGIVRSLSTEAPAAILAETAGVADGLELDGDEIRIGGVSLDRLCGAEQMKFAAQIARALNPNVGFLVVDGLERLDPDQLEAFVEAATSDDRQLFGSLVARGELVLAAIEHRRDAAAAE